MKQQEHGDNEDLILEMEEQDADLNLSLLQDLLNTGIETEVMISSLEIYIGYICQLTPTHVRMKVVENSYNPQTKRDEFGILNISFALENIISVGYIESPLC